MAKTAKKSTGKKTLASKAVSASGKKKSAKTVPAKVSKKVSKTKTTAIEKPKTAKKAVKKAVPSKVSKPEIKAVKGKAPAKKAIKSPGKQSEVKSQAQRLADAAIHGILEKKGRNVICMDLKNVPNAVCDYFIICEADSTRQVSAIADSVDYEVKKATGENPFHTEGWENSLWILLDYVNVVIHVFEAETRHFYRLESLWADAEVKEYGVEYA